MRPVVNSDTGTPRSVCLGTSMYPTLKVSDVLIIEPYRMKGPRPGDVAVFRNPDSGEIIAHRIIAVHHGHITTGGDNNDGADFFVIGPNDIIGKVVAAGQGKNRRRIDCGPVGRIVGWKNRIRRAVSRHFARTLHAPYRCLAGTGVLANLLPSSLKPRIVCFNRPEGLEFHLFIGKRAIGVRRASDAEWRIARPFRLFIDESKLPDVAVWSSGDTVKDHGST